MTRLKSENIYATVRLLWLPYPKRQYKRMGMSSCNLDGALLIL